jgi:hypothetical protein
MTRPQRPVTRFLVEGDRGEYVRDTASYLRLAHQVFTYANTTTLGTCFGAHTTTR